MNPPSSALALWGLNALVWSLLGVFHSAHMFFAYPLRGHPLSVGEALESGLVNSLGWFVLTPLLYALVRWLEPGPGRWGRGGLALGLACVVLTFTHPLVHIAFDQVAHTLRGEDFALRMHLSEIMISGAWFNMMTAAGISAAVLAARAVRQAQERALRAAQLEALLGAARLEALRLQLNPHFLFNTLNSISALVSVDPETAERMIARLGDLLRVTLEAPGGDEVVLARELEVLNLYLDIERLRFGDRLTVDLRLDPGVESLAVPAFVLQPLVENALKHGVAARSGPARVALRAERAGERLRLCVRDDGPGLGGRSPEALETGVGLRNARARLEALYGDEAGLSLQELEGGGVEVCVTLPARGP